MGSAKEKNSSAIIILTWKRPVWKASVWNSKTCLQTLMKGISQLSCQTGNCYYHHLMSCNKLGQRLCELLKVTELRTASSSQCHKFIRHGRSPIQLISWTKHINVKMRSIKISFNLCGDMDNIAFSRNCMRMLQRSHSWYNGWCVLCSALV